MDLDALRIALDQKEWQLAGTLLPKLPLAEPYPFHWHTNVAGACDIVVPDSKQTMGFPEPLGLVPAFHDRSADGTAGTSELDSSINPT